MANRFLNNIKINDSYTLPSADGTANQIIVTDGSGNLSFTDNTVDTAASADKALSLTLRVKNTEAVALTKGQVVCAAPSATPPSGNVIEVKLADNDGTDSMPAIGILNEGLDAAGGANDEGEAIMFGRISGINTSAFAVGDEVFVSDTPGGLTATKPTGVKYIQKIGVVIRDDASNGTIEVFGAGRTNDVPTPLYIDHANQRVGVGVELPAQKLHVDGNILFGDSHFIGNQPTYDNLLLLSSTGENIVAAAANDVYLNTGATSTGVVGTTRLYIRNTDGNVGIGTTSPGSKLHVHGTSSYIKVSESTNSYNVVEIGADSTGDGVINLRDSGNGIKIKLYAEAGAANYFNNGGNVGIGTTNPSFKFDVSSTDWTQARFTSTSSGYAPASILLETSAGSSTSRGQGVFLYSNDSDTAWYSGTAYNDNNQNFMIAYQSKTTWSSDMAQKSNALLTINNGGNVGIGTVSPSSKLEVNGTAAASSFTSNNFSAGVQGFAIESGDSAVTTYRFDANRFRFYSGNYGDLVSIQENGNVGIGTSGPGAKLQVDGNGSFNSSLNIQHPDVGFYGLLGLSHDSSGSSLYSNPGSSNTSIVVLRLGINNSEKMRIANNGNVGIGTTSPSEKLHVAGNMRLQNQLYDSTNSQGTFNDVLTKVSAGTEWKSISDLPIDSRYVAVTGDTMTGNLTIGDGSADNYVRSYFSDGTYAEMRGYGMQFSRGASYLRPTSDKNLALNVGNDGQTWNQVRLNTNEFTIERDADTFVKVNSAGNVGIGITSPLCRLHIGKALNTGNTTEEFRIQTATSSGFGGNAVVNLVTGTYGTSGVYFGANSTYSSQPGKIEYADSSGTLSYNALTHYWRSNNNIKMTLLSSGNFGIGTTNPTAKLHVSSGAADEDCVVIIESDTDNNDETSNPRLELRQDNGAVIGRLGFRDNTNSLELINQYAEPLYLGTSNSTDLTILSNGNVGIGTTSPLTKLHLDFGTLTNGDINELVLQSKADGSTYYNNSAITGITFTNWINGYTAGSLSRAAGIYGYNADTAERFGRYMGLSFYTSSLDANATEKMRIDQSGNVGIGTTGPGQKLSVAPSTDVSGEFGYAHVGNVGYNGYAGFSHVNRNSQGNYALLQESTGTTFLNASSGQSIKFRINNSDKMLLDSSGNFSIGANTTSAKLEVRQGANNGNTGAFTNTHVKLTASATADNTGFVGITAATSTSDNYGYSFGAQRTSGGVGNFKINYHNNSAAGTNRFIIDQSGNVGIGTTGPAEKLAVNGSIRIPRAEEFYWTDGSVNGNPRAVIFSTDNEFGGDYNGIGFSIGANGRTNPSMYIRGTGNVGIGAAPSEKLEVQGSVNNDDIAILIENNYDDNLSTSRPAAALLFSTASNNGYLRVYGAPADTAANHQIDLGSTAGTSYLTFSPSGSEKMRIDSSGNVGIGTTNPAEKLDVAGSIKATGTIWAGYDSGVTNSVSCSNWFRSSGTTGWYAASYGGGIYMTDSTNVTIYNNKAFRVNNTGTLSIRSAGDIVAYYSDERLKTNLGNITNAVDKVKKLNGFYYTNNDLAQEFGYTEEQVQVGVSAQEVENVMPEVVKPAPFDLGVNEDGSTYSISGDNYKTVKYEKLVPLLIEAIKEQQEQIDELKNQLDAFTK